MGKAVPGSPLPALSHPPPFSRGLSWVLCRLCFQLWALILSFSRKARHMEGNSPKGREFISLTPVTNGLENMGAELLESLVCPLPHPHFGPLVGGPFVRLLPSPPLPLCLKN